MICSVQPCVFHTRSIECAHMYFLEFHLGLPFHSRIGINPAFHKNTGKQSNNATVHSCFKLFLVMGLSMWCFKSRLNYVEGIVRSFWCVLSLYPQIKNVCLAMAHANKNPTEHTWICVKLILFWCLRFYFCLDF